MPIQVWIIGTAGVLLTMGISYLLRNSFKLAPQLIFAIIGVGFWIAATFSESWVGLGYMILAFMFVATAGVSAALTALFIKKE
jgi:hypothetical protein